MISKLGIMTAEVFVIGGRSVGKRYAEDVTLRICDQFKHPAPIFNRTNKSDRKRNRAERWR